MDSRCVGYWRKANAIHRWFVHKVQNGVDNCDEHYVSREQLAELRSECQAVLDNPDIAANKMPTQNGFFFGATAYGDGYLEDLRDTVKIIDAVLSDPNLEDCDLQYRASW